MCGRYTLVSKLKVLEECFQAKAAFSNFADLNISTTDLAPVINSSSPHTTNLMQFDLQPPWATKSMLLFNARSKGDHNLENSTQYRGALEINSEPGFPKSGQAAALFSFSGCLYGRPRTTTTPATIFGLS